MRITGRPVSIFAFWLGVSCEVPEAMHVPGPSLRQSMRGWLGAQFASMAIAIAISGFALACTSAQTPANENKRTGATDAADPSGNDGDSSSGSTSDESAAASVGVSGTNLVFTIPPDVDPATVTGYVVGHVGTISVQLLPPDGDAATAAQDPADAQSRAPRFVIKDMPEGQNDIVILAQTLAIQTQLKLNGGPSRGRKLTGIVMDGGKKKDLGEIEIPEVGGIKGRIRLSDGTSALGAEAFVPGTTFIAKADDSGAFAIGGMPEGEYRMAFQQENFFIKSLSGIAVFRGEITDLDPIALSAKDEAAPGTEITAGPAPITRANYATVKFESTEPNSAFQCRLDNSPYAPCTSPSSFSDLGEGAHTLEVFSTDGSGNADQSPAIRQWTIDFTPPLLVVEENPTQITAETTAIFRFSASDAATFECRLDDSKVPCGLTNTFANLAPGLHTLVVVAADSVGNKSSAKVISWQIDTSILNTIALALPPALSNQTTATVSFTANKTASFTCKLDSGTFQPCSSPYTLSAVANGPHSVAIVATDLAGVSDATPLLVLNQAQI